MLNAPKAAGFELLARQYGCNAHGHRPELLGEGE